MEPDHLDHDQPMSVRCAQCGELPEWESIADAYEERWLAVCRCGRMQTFLPDQPAAEPKDPLAAFLLGAGRDIPSPTPPWIRLFMRSLEQPWNTRWRYSPEPCSACAERVCFGVQ